MQKQRFSLRKYKFGLASVFLGTALVFGAGQVQADQQTESASPAAAAEVVTADSAVAETSAATPVQAVEAAAETSAGITPAPAEAQPQPTGSQDPAAEKVAEKVAVPAKAAESPVQPAAAASTANGAEKTAAAQPEASKSDAGKPEAAQPAAHTGAAEAVPASPAAAATEGPAASQDQPTSVTSNDIINIPQTWSKGYKGEGQLIAVIDSGLDVHHEVLRISDPSKAKYKNAAEIEAAKKQAGIDYGQWYNDKVVFAYNYIDGDETIKEKDNYSHGMHVTGISAGNPDKKDANGQFIYGVAPEAQVMFMRVFSDRNRNTTDAIYVKAIDDAVALGADAINMSLGSEAGSTVNASPAVIAAVQRARAKGVSVLISAGNSNTFGNGHSRPLAENPDYGVVGNPSTVEDSISVASVNDTVLVEEVFTVKGLEDNEALNHGKVTYVASEANVFFEKGREYEYVAVGLGQKEDLEGKDLTGKVALIQRGAITFAEKINNAVSRGAIGALVYNNAEGANFQMGLDTESKKVPSVFISKQVGEALKAGNYRFVFDGQKVNLPAPDGKQMSDFTSWGVTADGQLKPDVTAPGGNIYSSLNDNTYGSMSGTSMAAPHVSGVAAIVKEYLSKEHPDKSPAEVSELVKALIMSTAKLHVNEETGTYTSPRQQGAGIVDTAAAVSTDLYVTGEDSYPSVSLGNVGDSFSFDVIVHNISDQDRTLKTIINTQTDQVEDGHLTLTPRKLTETVWPEVTVKAKSSQRVTVKVDASKYSEELTKLMPNGYFLEGFVRFVDPADDGDVISLPFMGFRGAFQDLPVAEQPIYKLIKDGKSGFYYDLPEYKSILATSDATTLLTTASDRLYSNGSAVTRSPIVLGTVENEEGKNILQLDADGNVRLAFSPNNDGNKDVIQYRTVLYRNTVNLKAAVYAADDTELRNPIWESVDSWDARKNYFDKDDRNPKSYLVDNTEWNGLDQEGRPVKDGLYNYVVRYSPAVPGAAEQQVAFKLQIDTQKPVITSGYITVKDGQETFTARKPQDAGNGGILRQQVFYLQADKDGKIQYQAEDELGNVRDYEHRVYIKANEDGSYTLPKDVDKANIFYLVEDYAGNKDVLSLAQLVGDENSGRFQVALLDADSRRPIDTSYVYRIKDAAGKYVDIDKGKGINFLTFGRYVAEIFAYDTAGIKFKGAKSQEFELSADDSFKTIEFFAKELFFAPLSVVFDQAVPKNTQVLLKDQDGEAVLLPAERYGKNSFGKSVAAGVYTLIANLPTGYELWDENPRLVVREGQNNSIRLSVIKKLDLLAAVNKHTDLVKTSPYFNATEAARLSYDQAYETAKIALTSKLTQDEVNQILAELDNAAAALDGKDTDVAGFKEILEGFAAATQTGRYANAKERNRQAFDKAFRAAALLALKEDLTQEQIDNAVADLTAAEGKLDGKETDFTALNNLLDAEVKFMESSNRFIYAADDVKDAYLQAIDQAIEVLSDPGSSQAEVKEAIANVKAAKRKLNGKKPRAVKPKKP